VPGGKKVLFRELAELISPLISTPSHALFTTTTMSKTKPSPHSLALLTAASQESLSSSLQHRILRRTITSVTAKRHHLASSGACSLCDSKVPPASVTYAAQSMWDLSSYPNHHDVGTPDEWIPRHGSPFSSPRCVCIKCVITETCPN
jgi:hypothetical protein